MPVPDLVDGVLPPGRHVCTQDEIAERFVSHADFESSDTRPGIWADWSSAIELLTSSVKVHVAWISGSFVTDKQDPGDIDAVFFVNRADRAKRTDPEKQIIESFITRVAGPEPNTVVPAHGLSVDSFIVNWRTYNQLSDGQLTAPHQSYALSRGYWDDFWSRRRDTPKSQPPTLSDALPVRGYLEVRLNEFTV